MRIINYFSATLARFYADIIIYSVKSFNIYNYTEGNRQDEMSSVQGAVADLDESQALKEIRRRIGKGEDPDKVLEEARRGLRIVGERFNAKQYALIELEMADELFKECVKTIKSLSGKAFSGHPEKAVRMTPRLSKKTDMGRVD